MGTRRNERGEVEPLYEAGVEFDGILSRGASQLLRFIRTNAQIDMERRLFGRFSLRAGSSVTLGTSSEFVVRTLSLSGARLEAVLCPEPESALDVEIEVREGEVVRSLVRVVAVAPATSAGPGGEPAFFVDVEFREMPGDSRAALDRFVNESLEEPPALPVS